MSLTKHRMIESNLDAKVVTPRMYRQEMLQYVHRPTLHRIEFEPHDSMASTNFCWELHILEGINLRLQQTKPPDDARGYEAILQRIVAEQVDKFYQKASHVLEELGSWAAAYFIGQSIIMLKRYFTGEFVCEGRETSVKAQLLEHFTKGCLGNLPHELPPPSRDLLSHKAQQLVDFLIQQQPDSSGIVFVQQRATVAVLAALLSVHTRTEKRFRCGTFVGQAGSAKRKYSMAELLDLKAQQETLLEFRVKAKNLVIATDVLEEGIDISACNLVVCFSPPANVKSFIQRRGRARKNKSKFAIFFPKEDLGLFGAKPGKIEIWQSLEEQMIKTYQDDMRKREEAAKLEEETEEVLYRFEVESTGCVSSTSRLGRY